MNNALGPVSGKIVLKSTTKSSLNDRFTRVMSSNQQRAKNSNVILSQASLKNQRLAEQMSARGGSSKSDRGKRSPVIAAVTTKPSIKKSSRAPLKSRLGSISKSPKSRLGGVSQGTSGSIVPVVLPIMSTQLSNRMSGQRTFNDVNIRRSTRPYDVARVPARNTHYGQSSTRRSNTSVTSTRGRATLHGRGGISRSHDRGQFESNAPNTKSKNDLDKELEDYMVQSAKYS